MAKVSKVSLALQNGTERTIFAKWNWDKKHTKEYSVKWYYATGNDVWFEGNTGTVNLKNSTYTAPDNATKVKFTVKPISTTHTVNKKQTNYWTAEWSTAKVYKISKLSPSTPSVPSVSLNKYQLTSTVNVYDESSGANKAVTIEFNIVNTDSNKSYKTGKALVIKNQASYTETIISGNNYKYKVRCRAIDKDGNVSDWSEYSEEVTPIPPAPTSITNCAAGSSTSVNLDWNGTGEAITDSYEIQYTTNISYFDSNQEEVTSKTVESVVSHAEITGLESGNTYYFRLRSQNSQGSSAWTDIVYVTLGKQPSAPTTWSLSTTATVGEKIILYWVHNSEDGSSQTYAELELTVNGETSVRAIKNSTDEDEKDKTSSYSFTTDGFTDGATIQWRIRTKGIIDSYSNWSIQRTINVYAPPALQLKTSNTCKWFWDPFKFATDNIYTALGELGSPLRTLTKFPFYIGLTAGPNSQKAIRFFISIISNETYETSEDTGAIKNITAGDIVYSTYLDTINNYAFLAITAALIRLENNVSYTIHASVTMDSGLTAEAESSFMVALKDSNIEPNAEIAIDEDSLVAYITPYCINSDDINEEHLDNVYLSVYRREFDGDFTKIAENIDSSMNITVTDPHPALDYARYRIIAISMNTGEFAYYDMPGYPIQEKAIIIQWNDEWSTFNTTEENEMEKPPWSGSMLKLPYNIDVSDNYNPDVSLVEYIGRKHPVSYYGTQRGETPTWNLEIAKDDEETLYALRRLAVYMGDCYVREPSGSGCWAQVTVSFSQKHCEMTIPVTLSIVRVEGGV